VRDIFLISIKPPFAEAILSGQKRVEFRKTRPSFGSGARAVIYESRSEQCIVGVFEVKKIEEGTPQGLWRKLRADAGVSRSAMLGYFDDAPVAYGIVIAWARRVRPRPLPHGLRPPQTWLFLDRGTPRHRELVRLASHAPKRTVHAGHGARADQAMLASGRNSLNRVPSRRATADWHKEMRSCEWPISSPSSHRRTCSGVASSAPASSRKRVLPSFAFALLSIRCHSAAVTGGNWCTTWTGTRRGFT
jgi:predicted transcriptional regulator